MLFWEGCYRDRGKGDFPAAKKSFADDARPLGALPAFRSSTLAKA